MTPGAHADLSGPGGAAEDGRSWARRNRWGLVALPLAAALALWPTVGDAVHRADLGIGVVAGAVPGQWATVGGAGFRLDRLTRSDWARDRGGLPLRLPPGTAIWRADITVRYPAGAHAESCLSYLVDGDGRRYEADPSELGRQHPADVTCPVDDPGKRRATSSSTTVRLSYLVPQDRPPSAIWITTNDAAPHYAELRSA
jgi:hypothetical protein